MRDINEQTSVCTHAVLMPAMGVWFETGPRAKPMRTIGRWGRLFIIHVPPAQYAVADRLRTKGSNKIDLTRGRAYFATV